MCGPACIGILRFNYANTDVKILSTCRPLLCIEINVRAWREIKLYNLSALRVKVIIKRQGCS